MVNIHDLSLALTDKYGLSESDAQQFITQMFELVVDELQSSSSSVKIKGLGIFKVSSVGSRESVDVNTGERIVINGRNKIAFTPDVVMRDRVNRPFSQFETVILNDGVDFSEMNECLSENFTDIDSLEDDNPEKSETRIAEAIEPQSVDAEESLINKNTEDDDDGSEPLKVDTSDETFDRENIVTSESGGEQNDSVTCKGEVKDEDFEPVSSYSENSLSEKIDDNEAISGGFLHVRCMKICCISVIVAVVLCSFCFGVYYMYDLLQQRNQRICILEKEIAQMTATNRRVNEDLMRLDSVNTIGAVATTATDRPDNADSLSVYNGSINANDKSIKIDYESDPRLRVGAYTIIGVDRIVVVKKGQTLKSISKAYLGSDMECYVEALNACHFAVPGDSLKIPKLKLKKRSK